MKAFDMTATKGQDFFYRRGKVYTTKVWGRPSYDLLKSFLKKIKSETTILTDYNVYVMGGVLYSFEDTWDVDFCITGNISDHNKLESQMNEMYDLALNEFKILIDIQWLEIPLPEISHEQLMSPNFQGYRLKFIKTTPIIKKVGDSESIWDLRTKDGVIKITENLVEGFHDNYPGTKEKVLNRIKNSPNRTLKSVMNVWDILNNDEEFFNKNTNRF